MANNRSNYEYHIGDAEAGGAMGMLLVFLGSLCAGYIDYYKTYIAPVNQCKAENLELIRTEAKNRETARRGRIKYDLRQAIEAYDGKPGLSPEDSSEFLRRAGLPAEPSHFEKWPVVFFEMARPNVPLDINFYRTDKLDSVLRTYKQTLKNP